MNQTENLAAEQFKFGRQIPNIITFLRLIAVPFFVFLMYEPTSSRSFWATIVFVMASLSDWLDGYIARLYHAESILGTLLDPVADKILVTSALVMLCAVNDFQRVPPWIVVALLSRDLLVSGLRSLAAIQGNLVAVSNTAKLKTAFTMLAIFFLLLRSQYSFLGITLDCFKFGMYLLYFALILSIVSGADYAIRLRKVLK